MPKIPRYEPSVPTPWAPEAATISPAVAGIEGEAMTQAGAAAIGMGKELKTFYETLENVRKASVYAESKLKMREGMATLIGELEGHQDWEKIPKLFDEQSKQIYQDVVGSVTDSEVQTHLKRVWANSYPEMKLKVTRLSRQKMIGQVAANTAGQEDRFVKQAAAAGTPEEEAKIKSEWISTVRTMAQFGVLAPDKAQKYESTFDFQVSAERFSGIINKDPVAALRLAQEGKIPGFNNDDHRKAVNMATAAVHRGYEQHRLNLEKMMDAGKLTLPVLKEYRDSLKISVPMFNHYEALLQGMAANPENRQDENLAIDLHDRALMMNPGDTNEFNKLRAIVMNKGTLIKTETRRQLLNMLYKKLDKPEGPEDTHEKMKLEQVKKALKPDLYRTFYHQYIMEKDKRGMAGGYLTTGEKSVKWTHEEITEIINRISAPYIERQLMESPHLYTPPPPQQPQAPGAAPPNQQQKGGRPYWMGNQIFKDPSWR